MVWARAVDAVTGAAIRTTTWSQVLPKDRQPLRRALLFPAVMEPSGSGPPQHVLAWQSGDYQRSFVLKDPTDATVEFGPLAARAPGYQAKEVILKARSPVNSRTGPQVVRLVPTVDTTFTDLVISLRTQRTDVRTRIELRKGKRTIFWKFWRSGSSGVIKIPVTPGDYSLEVGGNTGDLIHVDAMSPQRRVVDLDQLPSLRIRFELRGQAYGGAAGVFLRTDTGGRGEWAVGFTDIPFDHGASPRFIVPANRLLIGVSAPDATTAIGRTVVRAQEHVAVSLAAD